MNSNPLVSILVPTYNRERLIEETIQSALNQTYSNVEVIVVDNASTDNTWKILSEIALTEPRLRIFNNESNIGPVRNWKRCMDEARGEYAKILWSDDLIEPQFIERCVDFLAEKDVGFVITKAVEFVDKTNELIGVRYNFGKSGKISSKHFIKESLLLGDAPYSPGCAMFRLSDLREALEIDIPNRIGADFANLAIGNDVLLFLNVAARYEFFYFIDEPLAKFRHHDGSITVQSKDRQLYYCVAKAHFVNTTKIANSVKLDYYATLWLICLYLRKNGVQCRFPDSFFPPIKPREYSFVLKIPKMVIKLFKRR
jgi:glycosyltransferase involved in cell wall biosynthesis